MSESLDVLKLRVLLCFLNEEPKTCTVTGLAGVLGEGKQKVSRMLMALEREGLLDRSDPRRPCLTEAGRARAAYYEERTNVVLNHLLYEGLDIDNALHDAYAWALMSSDEGMARLHPMDLSARSQMTGREMNGRVRRLMYLDGSTFAPAYDDGSTFAPAYDDGSTISFPARTLHFLNIGSGVGQILHGSVCLRMQCSVGTKHMPESTAIFTILI